jgi:Phage derived protein Gp49-like (DUF891)
VHELIEDHRGGTYRAVYTVRFATRIHGLHAFQKKAKMDFLTILGQDVEVTLKLASTRTTGICQLSFNPANRASPRPFRPEVLLNLGRQVLG